MSEKELVGVKGWLLFLVLNMGVFSVIVSFASFGQFSLAELINPDLKLVFTWQSFKNWSRFLIIIATCLGIFSAYKLYYKHEKSSVELAIFTLWVAGPVCTILIMLLGYKLVNGYKPGVALKGLISSITAAICWTLYLNKSVRVKNTYYNDQIINKSQYGDDNIHNDPINEGYLKTINNMSHNTPEKQLDIPFQTHKKDTVKQSEPIMSNNEHYKEINEDELYLQATQEVDDSNQDKALWAKCMALCEGDEGKAKYKYIKERVDRLRELKMKEIEEEAVQQNILFEKNKFKRQALKILQSPDELSTLLESKHKKFVKSKAGKYYIFSEGALVSTYSEDELVEFIERLLE